MLFVLNSKCNANNRKQYNKYNKDWGTYSADPGKSQ